MGILQRTAPLLPCSSVTPAPGSRPRAGPGSARPVLTAARGPGALQEQKQDAEDRNKLAACSPRHRDLSPEETDCDGQQLFKLRGGNE